MLLSNRNVPLKKPPGEFCLAPNTTISLRLHSTQCYGFFFSMRILRFANPDQIRIVLFFALLSCMASAFALKLPLFFPLGDPFHAGEFLAAGMAVLYGAPFEGDPFTINGGADIFPLLVISFLVNQMNILSRTPLRLKFQVQHPRPSGHRMLQWTNDTITSASRNVA